MKLEWIPERQPESNRYVGVRDGIVTCYAVIPSGMTLEQATEDYAAGADYHTDCPCSATLVVDGEEVEFESFTVAAEVK